MKLVINNPEIAAGLQKSLGSQFRGIQVISPQPLTLPGNYRSLESRAVRSRLAELATGKVKVDAEFDSKRKTLFATIAKLKLPIAIVLDACEDLYFIHLRTQPQGGPDESFFVSIYPLESAEKIYESVHRELAQLGFTAERLSKRLRSVEHELAEVFDEVAYLFKQRVSRKNLIIRPHLSHHTGKAVMKVLRSHGESLKLEEIKTVFARFKDARSKQLLKYVNQLAEGEFEVCEEWILEVYPAAKEVYQNMEHIWGGRAISKATALLVADLCDILGGLYSMTHGLREAKETSRDYKYWMGAKISLGLAKTGQGAYRKEIVEGKKKTVGKEDDGPVIDREAVIQDLIDVCDIRFNFGEDGGFLTNSGPILDMLGSHMS